MKFKYIELKNYVGIYNGLGIDKISIDFTRCKYNTVVIKAKNGSGKSTLMGALNPLPDDNTSLIPKAEAYKKIGLITADGILYDIHIVHPIKPDMSRGTTKAQLWKTVNGEKINLNPNGNVGSFKSIIFDELSLDPNFIALSQLGSEDRGLVDKTPAERKGLVNSIVDKVEVYNNMYKTLSKRSSSFKSIVNRLISKMDNLGNREGILESLKSLEVRINKIMKDRDIALQDLANNKSTILLIDPDGFIQNKYDVIYNKIKIIDEELNSIDFTGYNIDEIPTLIEQVKKDINANTNNIIIIENKISNMMINIEDHYKTIREKESRLLSSELDNVVKYKDEIENKKLIILEYEKLFDEMGFTDTVTLTKDEYIAGINVLKDIKEIINILTSDADSYALKLTINEYFAKHYKPDITKLDSTIEQLELNRSEIEASLQVYREYENITNNLNIRPTGCNIDTCGFIKDAIDARNKEPKKNIEKLERELRHINSNISKAEEERKLMNKVLEYLLNIDRILRYVNSSINILKKLPNMYGIMNNELLLERILLRNDFIEIDNLYKYIEYCDAFNDYSIQKDNLYKLESEYKIYKNKLENDNIIKNEISEIYNKIEKIDIQANQELISIYKNNLTNLYSLQDEYEKVNLNLVKKKELDDERLLLMSEFYNIKINMEKIKSAKDNIYKLDNNILEYDKTLTPLLKERDDLSHAIRSHDEYSSDLELYNSKFEKIKEIRYHCTPSTGIQLLFINIYMNKTLSLANELLSYVFDGEFVLSPYIINDKEFRIPCIGEGLPRDDISNLSNSQKSIMSMILSFVLLKQSSTSYNILKLDEIDAPLDEANRIRFIQLMDNLMRLLEVEQCIMISHNSEINLDNCDVIVLKTEHGETFGGNIIYQYDV